MWEAAALQHRTKHDLSGRMWADVHFIQTQLSCQHFLSPCHLRVPSLNGPFSGQDQSTRPASPTIRRATNMEAPLTGGKRKTIGGRGREWAHHCHKLLESMRELDDSEYFRNPVDSLQFKVRSILPHSTPAPCFDSLKNDRLLTHSFRVVFPGLLQCRAESHGLVSGHDEAARRKVRQSRRVRWRHQLDFHQLEDVLQGPKTTLPGWVNVLCKINGLSLSDILRLCLSDALIASPVTFETFYCLFVLETYGIFPESNYLSQKKVCSPSWFVTCLTPDDILMCARSWFWQLKRGSTSKVYSFVCVSGGFRSLHLSGTCIHVRYIFQFHDSQKSVKPGELSHSLHSEHSAKKRHNSENLQ